MTLWRGASRARKKFPVGLHQELPVYKASYDLLLAIFGLTGQFKREYKYTVGEKLKQEALDLLTLIYRANSRMDRVALLQEARERIEIIRLFLRVMMDMHQIGLQKFVHINRLVEAVSKQLTGWQKASSLTEKQQQVARGRRSGLQGEQERAQ